MKTLNIDIDYKRDESSVKQLPNKVLTTDYINAAVASVHKEGLGGQKRRVFGRIQRKLDDVISDDTVHDVELEEAEIDFLIETFSHSQCVFPAHVSKYVVILEDLISKLRD